MDLRTWLKTWFRFTLNNGSYTIVMVFSYGISSYGIFVLLQSSDFFFPDFCLFCFSIEISLVAISLQHSLRLRSPLLVLLFAMSVRRI